MSSAAPVTRTPLAPLESVVVSISGMRRRNGSSFGIGAGGIGVGDVFGGDAHAHGLRAHAGGGGGDGGLDVGHLSFIYLPGGARRHAHQFQALLVERDAGFELHPRFGGARHLLFEHHGVAVDRGFAESSRVIDAAFR